MNSLYRNAQWLISTESDDIHPMFLRIETFYIVNIVLT